jgi:hypothetical protein
VGEVAGDTVKVELRFKCFVVHLAWRPWLHLLQLVENPYNIRYVPGLNGIVSDQ